MSRDALISNVKSHLRDATWRLENLSYLFALLGSSHPLSLLLKKDNIEDLTFPLFNSEVHVSAVSYETGASSWSICVASNNEALLIAIKELDLPLEKDFVEKMLKGFEEKAAQCRRFLGPGIRLKEGEGLG